MGLRDGLNNLLNPFRKQPMESTPIVEVGAHYGPNNLPEGFFHSHAGESEELGFYCPRCNFLAKYGADLGVVHCGKREDAPEDKSGLPVVAWAAQPQQGVQRLRNGDGIMDAQSNEWDGEVGYEPSDPGF